MCLDVVLLGNGRLEGLRHLLGLELAAELAMRHEVDGDEGYKC